jgi:putative ATP-dependent DNA ligase
MSDTPDPENGDADADRDTEEVDREEARTVRLLGLEDTGLDDALEHFNDRSYDGHDYRALTDARHGMERGTVLVDDTAVRGFPSVPRILALDAGIRQFFADDERVAVEEKMDGFNVRIARIDAWAEDDGDGSEGGSGSTAGPVVGFTRSGFVCPYTTSRVNALLDTEAFFDDHPDLMLCGEFVGPETPYTDHDYEGIDSHDFRVFDVREQVSGDPLAVKERRDLLDEYDLPQPSLFGIYDPDDATGDVWDAIDDLDEQGREGVMLKSTDGERLVKYTTHSKHVSELEYGFWLPFEVGRDYVFSRLIREGFMAAERGEAGERLEDRAHEIGEAILYPMVEAIRTVSDGEGVGEEHTVRGAEEELDALFDHLGSVGVNVEVEERYEGEEGRTVVGFTKVSEQVTDQIEAYLNGTTVNE